MENNDKLPTEDNTTQSLNEKDTAKETKVVESTKLDDTTTDIKVVESTKVDDTTKEPATKEKKSNKKGLLTALAVGVVAIAGYFIYDSMPNEIKAVQSDNGTVTLQEGEYKKGDLVEVVANADDGYMFTGFTTTGDGSFSEQVAVSEFGFSEKYTIESLASYTVKKDDSTISATFSKIPTYSVKVVAKDGGVVASLPKDSYYFGEEVTIKATPNENYKFASWTATDDTITIDKSKDTITFTVPDNTVDIIANFEALPTYDVKVVAKDGGTVEEVKDKKYEGNQVTLKATPKTGYTFAGWTTDKDVKLKDKSSTTTTFEMPNSNVNVTAKFTAIPKATTTTSNNNNSATSSSSSSNKSTSSSSTKVSTSSKKSTTSTSTKKATSNKKAPAKKASSSNSGGLPGVTYVETDRSTGGTTTGNGDMTQIGY